MLFVGTEPFRIDILEQHYDELGFLLLQRNRQIYSPELTRAALRDKDERIAAHLDGLRLAGEAALPVVLPGLAADDPGEAAAAGATLLESQWAGAADAILQALREGTSEALSGLRLGLRQGSARHLAEGLSDLVDSASVEPAARVAAAEVLAFHRQTAPKTLVELLNVCPADWRAVLYSSVGRFGGPWSTERLMRALAEDEPAARRAALETSARLGLPGLADTCRDRAGEAAPDSIDALEFLGVVGNQQDLPLLHDAARASGTAPAALSAMGRLGLVASIPVLIEAMDDPALTRVAGHAFERITGSTQLEGTEPLPPPVDMTEEELLFFDPVVPFDSAKAHSYWNRHQSRFSGDHRWQAGLEVPPRWNQPLLEQLPLNIRRDVYLGWRAADPSRTPDTELEAATFPWNPHP